MLVLSLNRVSELLCCLYPYVFPPSPYELIGSNCKYYYKYEYVYISIHDGSVAMRTVQALFMDQFQHLICRVKFPTTLG
jgi:hypothetical protein